MSVSEVSKSTQTFAGKNLDKDLYGDDLDRIISTNRFVPDKGFSGVEPGVARNAGPVEVCFDFFPADVYYFLDIL